MPRFTDSIEDLVAAAAALPRGAGLAPAIGVSGIDGSGKSWLSARLREALADRSWRVRVLSVDDWRTLPHERFRGPDWGATFYTRSYRWDDVRGALEAARRSGDADIVILEGIFTLAEERRAWFDMTVWVDCAFEVALHRALARNQEGLDPDALRDEYERVYWPAQRLHIVRDRPGERADWVFRNGAPPVKGP